MFFLQLKRWLTKLVMSLRQASIIQESDQSSRRMVSPAIGQSRLSESDGTNSSSWLDDSRRMRPPATSSERTQPQETNSPLYPPAVRTYRIDEHAQKPPAAKVTLEHDAGDGTASTAPFAARLPRENGNSNDSPLLDGNAAESAAQGSAYDRVTRQRLMALRRLVRMGIYNEGFASDHVPAQYYFSLGRDQQDDPADE